MPLKPTDQTDNQTDNQTDSSTDNQTNQQADSQSPNPTVTFTNADFLALKASLDERDNIIASLTERVSAVDAAEKEKARKELEDKGEYERLLAEQRAEADERIAEVNQQFESAKTQIAEANARAALAAVGIAEAVKQDILLQSLLKGVEFDGLKMKTDLAPKASELVRAMFGESEAENAGQNKQKTQNPRFTSIQETSGLPDSGSWRENLRNTRFTQ